MLYQWHRVPPLTAKILPKSGKEEKIRKSWGKIGKKTGKKEDKSGRNGKNLEVSFTLPLLTDRAGYATVLYASFLCTLYKSRVVICY